MIEFRNVSKIYNNGTEALHDINLKVSKGEFVFIVGASGAGKSTFLKLVMCEEHPNSGHIIIDGQDVSRIRKRKIPYVRRKMGIVFQDFRLIEHMTVYDNVAFAMRVVGASSRAIKKHVPNILGIVGLIGKEKNFPTELSGGERQRVGLARALVNEPSMIVADEPTGNIDPALSYEIVDLLNKINQSGTTVLMVTHEHSLVKHFHKRIIQIHSGEIVADTGEIRSSVEQHNEIDLSQEQLSYEPNGYEPNEQEVYDDAYIYANEDTEYDVAEDPYTNYNSPDEPAVEADEEIEYPEAYDVYGDYDELDMEDDGQFDSYSDYDDDGYGKED